ncbi:MAG TPA: glycosyltransferase family 4 protein [Thermoanaerobaculia bacterium]|nr:glycosyltransferase family 4 protein [Thermoanaerobaculia bacterium]
MHVHYYKQFYTGPDSPGTQQPRELAATLARRGHKVDVVATDFNVYSEQSERAELIQFAGGGEVRVHRLPTARGLRSGLLARLRSYLGFVWPALQKGLSLTAPDVVIGSIQPLFTGWVALGVARRRRAPLILEVRDLWPDALEAKGAVTGVAARLLHFAADGLYARADRIVSLTPGIKVELLKKGVNPSRLDVFPNGFSPELFRIEQGDREAVRRRYGWGESFVALYAGTHTEVTAVDVIVRAAAELRHRPGIRLDLFGRGQTKARAMELARELGLVNVHFHDPVGKNAIPALIDAADVCVMALFRSPLIHIYFENKFVDYLGAGKPVVASMGGQQAELLRRLRAGRVVPSMDHEGLAGLIAEAADNPDALKTMGENGRRFVERSLLLPMILERYADTVEAVANGTAAGVSPWEPFDLAITSEMATSEGGSGAVRA